MRFEIPRERHNVTNIQKQFVVTANSNAIQCCQIFRNHKKTSVINTKYKGCHDWSLAKVLCTRSNPDLSILARKQVNVKFEIELNSKI